MPRFVGVKNNKIGIVSNQHFVNDEYSLIELPEELNEVSAKDLIASYKYKDGKIFSRGKKKIAKELRVAFVSNYGQHCGISTYSNYLYNELIDLIGDYKLFIEKNDIFEIENHKIPTEKIIACWKRGEDLSELIGEIKKYDPDIILIQHEFGLWSNARYWITMMSQLAEYRIIVTMHSVFYHRDKTIVEACMPEIVVHLPAAKEVLEKTKQISGKVYVITHGCFPCVDREKLWNYYKTDHNFIQMGFLFRYKNFEASIHATALLKNKYPDVFFTAICSESEFSKLDHQMYYNDLIELTETLGVQNNIGLIRGYQSEVVLDSFLRTNVAAVFPYIYSKEHECFGASGAAPFTMTKGIPIITSSAHHFADGPSIKADTPKEIAAELDKLFSDWKYRDAQVAKQIKYLEDNSWAITAKRYVDIFENQPK